MKPAALWFAVLVTGCALTSKSTPAEIRYFSPDAVDARPASTTRVRASVTEPARLRLGRVTSSAHLRSKIVYRRSAFELGTYDDLRWTESPEVYLRRALSTALFEERGLAQAVGGPQPTLDVELIAFEEVRRGEACAGRVEIAYVLHDERDVIASGRRAVERDARSAEMDAVVNAIASALDAATDELADAVTKRLAVR